MNETGLREREVEEEETLLSVRIRVSSDSLYMLSKETLVVIFGAEGVVIQNIVQSGKVGYASFKYHL